MKKKDIRKIYDAKEFNNIKEIMYNCKEKFGDTTAFCIKHKKEDKSIEYENVSYSKMLDDINALGTRLYSLGLKGKRIAIIGKNRYEWILTHLANQLGGIVSVPLDKDLQLDELENSLIRSKADAIVFDPKIEDRINVIKENGTTNLSEYICMEKIEGYKYIHDLKDEGYKEIEEGSREYIDFEVKNDEMNVLLFTSGTTSKSKAVMLTQRNVASNIYALQCVEDIRPTDTNIAFLSFHHICGSSCIIWTLSCGLRNVFPDGLKYIKQNLKEYEVSVFVGVPVLVETIYKTIMKEIDKQGKTKVFNMATKISNLLLKLHIDLRRKLFKSILNELGGKLRFVVSGGAPADPKFSKGFNDLGIRNVQGYGLTETSPVIAGEDEIHLKPGTVGIPMINDTIEIVNKDANGIGEIRVKGPNVMLGYYEMEEETKNVLKDGWFYTGDTGFIDEEGYLTITGRQKDMIVLKNGKKVFPEEIEMLVNRLEVVKECMVFGMPDIKDKSNIKPAIKVVYNKDVAKELYGDKTEEELFEIIWEEIKKINLTLPKYKYLKHMVLTDVDLIKTTTNKIKRQEELKTLI